MSERLFNLRELELEADDGPEGHRFRLRSLTRAVGAQRTGMTIYELDPGQASWPYHFEVVEEEWLLVIEGELVLRTPDGERTLRTGDVACFPPTPAGAHAVRNASDSVVRYAMPSSVAEHGDACVYPDSGKFKISTDGFFHRGRLGDEVEYWEGEA
jgi:uncharacterized cupin superfamily protein